MDLVDLLLAVEHLNLLLGEDRRKLPFEGPSVDAEVKG
jgi:hypothetical protein